MWLLWLQEGLKPVIPQLHLLTLPKTRKRKTDAIHAKRRSDLQVCTVVCVILSVRFTRSTWEDVLTYMFIVSKVWVKSKSNLQSLVIHFTSDWPQILQATQVHLWLWKLIWGNLHVYKVELAVLKSAWNP